MVSVARLHPQILTAAAELVSTINLHLIINDQKHNSQFAALGFGGFGAPVQLDRIEQQCRWARDWLIRRADRLSHALSATIVFQRRVAPSRSVEVRRSRVIILNSQYRVSMNKAFPIGSVQSS